MAASMHLTRHCKVSASGASASCSSLLGWSKALHVSFRALLVSDGESMATALLKAQPESGSLPEVASDVQTSIGEARARSGRNSRAR